VSESPRGTQAFIKASDGWHPVVSSEELEATIRKLRKVEAERDEARREVCRLIAFGFDGPKGAARQRGWDCFEEEK